MRDLTSTTNSQQITDTIGGGVVELFYRHPTTAERFAFHKACLVQDGDEVKHDANPARLKFGLLVLTGFTPGYFTDNGQTIGTDPKGENYRADWKELIEETAGDLLMALGMAVFEGARFLGPKAPPAETANEPQGKPEKADPAAPLAISSGA